MNSKEVDLLVELVKQTQKEQAEIMESVREIRESQEECARILNQYRGAFRVTAWFVGTVIAVSGVVVAIFERR